MKKKLKLYAMYICSMLGICVYVQTFVGFEFGRSYSTRTQHHTLIKFALNSSSTMVNDGQTFHCLVEN